MAKIKKTLRKLPSINAELASDTAFRCKQSDLVTVISARVHISSQFFLFKKCESLRFILPHFAPPLF